MESQIAEAFPQLQKRVQALSTERLLLLISLLLSLLSTWQNTRPSEKAVARMVEQALANVQQAGEETMAEAFAAYQSGKTSLHGMRTKITHFFPELKDLVNEMNFDVLSLLVNIIMMVFMGHRTDRRALAQDAENERRETRRQEEFQAAQQYRAEIAEYAKLMVEHQKQAITKQQFDEGLSRLKDDIIREIHQEK